MMTLPLLPAKRPVDPDWTCQRSGECCTLPPEVVMTKEEAAVIVHAAPPEIHMEFRPLHDNFVALKAGPCPLYAFKTCLVYASRPFNCRRFGCMRPEPKSEPLELRGEMGMCKNMSDRVKVSRPALRLGQQMQRKAQRWARAHGWSEQTEKV